MTIWAWIQPTEKIWKVVSEPEKGTIKVYNERSDLILEKTELDEKSILLIEEHFLNVVAVKLTEDNDGKIKKDVKTGKTNEDKYNYMYV